jgi:hypothetical protein
MASRETIVPNSPQPAPDTLVVFTARPRDQLVAERGSQAWGLKPSHAKQMQWLLCVRNRNNADHTFSSGVTEAHGSGFLLGKITDVVPSDVDPRRYKVVISEYAGIDIPDVWQGWRNPVRYVRLSTLGIDPTRLDFLSMQPTLRESGTAAWQVHEARPGLSIADAKRQLAETFGVRPEAIEITIRA